MIDAINFGYSSIHAGSLKRKSLIRQFNNFSNPNDQGILVKSNSSSSRENLNSLLVVSGGFAAIGIISDIVARGLGLISGEVSADMAKNLFRNAAFMGIIGATCFGLFKLIEQTIFKKICE